MSLAVINSRALVGIDAPPVTVEVHLASGLPAFSIVGLPELAVRESRDRVRAAIINSNFEFPNRKITVNLAPADLPKEGGRFDLAIALGILSASGQLPKTGLDEYEFIGELALGGALRLVNGALPTALHCVRANRSLIVPIENANEAALAKQANILPAKHLLEVCQHFTNGNHLQTHLLPEDIFRVTTQYADLADVKGQQHAKRALEIAAAGQHNLLMIGPPGTGKTMLASRMPGILPDMTEEEAVESAIVASISTTHFDYQQWRVRPFRAPHHTASGVALVGGGSTPRPGEISLAHNGVLFLDELTEFDRSVLDVLREPMEKGKIIISRAARQAEFPARFQLIAAMNPCPCGHMGDPQKQCRCTPEQIKRYRGRISAPVLDRIDMHIRVPQVPREQLQKEQLNAETSIAVRERVIRCRAIQIQRAGCANSQLSNKKIEKFCTLQTEAQKILNQAMDKLGFSARAYHRILKVARTIADLGGKDAIDFADISEAISYRSLDRH